jgi:hypothetical protein
MCFLYALFARLYYGGELYIQISPLHFVVKCKGQLVHGTDKRGKWEIERREWSAYEKWLETGFHPLTKIA